MTHVFSVIFRRSFAVWSCLWSRSGKFHSSKKHPRFLFKQKEFVQHPYENNRDSRAKCVGFQDREIAPRSLPSPNVFLFWKLFCFSALDFRSLRFWDWYNYVRLVLAFTNYGSILVHFSPLKCLKRLILMIPLQKFKHGLFSMPFDVILSNLRSYA